MSGNSAVLILVESQVAANCETLWLTHDLGQHLP